MSFQEEEEVIPVSADSDQGAAALVKEPSIDSPPKKRKRESKLSTFHKGQPAEKKGKSKRASKKAQDDGLKKCDVDFVRGRRVSPEGVVSFLLKVKGVKATVWVEDKRVSGDSVHCWLSGEEEEGDS